MEPVRKYGWCRTGLRVRYVPRVRICGGLVTSAPYVDVVLIFVIFILLSTRAVMGPGILIDLPETTDTVGVAHGITAVIRAYEAVESGKRGEMIYFDHDPFLVGDKNQEFSLKLRLHDVARESRDTPLLIESDSNVRHGTTMMLCDMAREAGFREVVFAMRQKGQDAKD